MPHVRDEGRHGGPCDQPRHDPRQSGKSKSDRGEHFRYTEEELEPRTPVLVTGRVESMWSTMYLASRPTPPNSAELNE
jgi:hypothetical protein